jgi:hypothetical protein
MAESYFVGLEFNEKEIRLCVYDPKEKDAVSVMITAGGSHAECPAHMAYIEETGRWKYGIEADYFAENKGAVLFEDVFDRVLEGRDFEANGKVFSGETVVAEMIKQAIAFAGIKVPAMQIEVLMITVPKISKYLTDTIEKAFKRMGLAAGQAYLQSFDESFYVHTYYQKYEVFSRDVGLFYFKDDTTVQFKKLHSDLTTRPATVTVTEGGMTILSLDPEKKDQEFADFINENVRENEYSSFFLVGKGFDRSWSKKSLGLLCRARRKVFYGTNLFSKGACYAAREKSSYAQLKHRSLFMGSDLVRKNIGIELLSEGIAVYHPLITAGINWYEAENECDIILNDERELVFRVSSLEDGKKINYSMPLTDLPERPAKATRLNIRIHFEAADQCVIDVKDLGFGEMFESSGLSWKEVL